MLGFLNPHKYCYSQTKRFIIQKSTLTVSNDLTRKLIDDSTQDAFYNVQNNTQQKKSVI